MTKRMSIMLAIVVIVLGGVFGFEAFRGIMIKKFMAGMGDQPQTVSTTVAKGQDWQPHLDAVGNLRAVNGADLSLEVAGIVDKIDFKSGDDVAQGAVLLELRAADDIAKLRSLQATAELANITYQRDQKQFKVQAVSQATLDADQANLKNAQALADQQQAIVDKKFVKAPFAGHLGIRAVDIGQYLAAGTVVVTLQALDPIFVDFFLPQQDLDQIKLGQKVAVQVDTYPKDSFAGEIVALSPKIDATTRNVQIRASIPNPDHRLLPGMYATIGVDAGTPQHYLTLPQTAVTYNTYGSTVFLVDGSGKDKDGKPTLIAKQSFITTGATRGDQVAVLNGIKEGDTVVTAGQMKLHNGSPLIVNNAIQPTDAPNPKPVDQ